MHVLEQLLLFQFSAPSGVSVGQLSSLSVTVGGAGTTSGSSIDGIKKAVKTSSIDCPTAISHRLVPDDGTSRHAKVVRMCWFIVRLAVLLVHVILSIDC